MIVVLSGHDGSILELYGFPSGRRAGPVVLASTGTFSGSSTQDAVAIERDDIITVGSY